MDLDFSGLTDDQLLALLRGAMQEAISRNPAMSMAAQNATLDALERVRIMSLAGEAEAATIRAKERERIAAEARAKARAEAAAQTAAERYAQQAKRDAETAIKKEEESKTWLARAAAIVDQSPRDISILYTDTRHGRRVIINLGHERYTKDHLSDYNAGEKTIKTKRELVKSKKELIAFSAEFSATNKVKTFLSGADYDWSK